MGSHVHEGGSWAPRRGRGGGASGTGLICGGFLLDDGETGDAEERVSLDLEPLVGNVVVAAAAASIVTGKH